MASLHLDNDVALEFQGLLGARGHDVTTAEECGLAHAGDEEQLLFGAQMHRILVTHNKKDFILLHRAWRRWTAVWGLAHQHAGILIIPQVKTYQRVTMAQELNTFVSSGLPRPNKLYRWQPGQGWRQYP